MNTGWEHKQAELWERVFQVTQDVVGLADMLGDGVGMGVCKTEMVKSAMNVGRHLVRANAAEDERMFRAALEEARLCAIETDYWLRLTYLLQQQEEVQRDLSSIINQYSSIVHLLSRLSHHPASAGAQKARRKPA